MTTETRRPITLAVTGRWEDFAACRTVDPDLFFPDTPRSGAKDRTSEAKRVCFACPVRRQCLEWALETEQNDGVLGGLTHKERRALKRKASRGQMPVRRSVAWECLEKNADQITAWKAEGMTGVEIARRLGVGTDAVYRWLRTAAAEQGIAELEVAA
ncbi:hypothetical protein GPZ77_34255 (plasmid) [Streptomyces sp. QHH-9511]|nr:hypothetical protein GPZ77_34255 [Streptomyces sp. QHH-9511]